jgi:uncharacterized protein YcbX
MPHAKITALNIFPVKSCRGIALDRAQLTATGFAHDRNWLIINEQNRFQTQRELPRLSLIRTQLDGSSLTLSAHGMPDLGVPAADGGKIPVTIWGDQCLAIDTGAKSAEWLSSFLNTAVRLVSFDASTVRSCDPAWVGAVQAQSLFADAFPLLVLSEGSLENLNHRLSSPVPMNRFRPNIVVGGLKAHDEDRIFELYTQSVRLRMVKPCTRCAITTTDQATGRVGEEPLRTLKSYRWDPALRGVTFGQNAIILKGVDSVLRVGEELEIAWA